MKSEKGEKTQKLSRRVEERPSSAITMNKKVEDPSQIGPVLIVDNGAYNIKVAHSHETKPRLA